MDIPSSARVVIIGGGVIGCSIAYHLAYLNETDVVLLERKKLTSGTTWHAAGLVAQLRATQNMTRLAKYSCELYGALEQETGHATGYRQHGSITLATHDERLHEIQRLASMARAFDVDVSEITPEEIHEKWPLLNIDDVVGGVWLPKDGQADPIGITHALAKGAKQKGVKFYENTKATDFIKKDNGTWEVITENGTINADIIVNAAGMWAREVGKKSGVNVPLHAAEHFYIVTDTINDLPGNLPVLRDPDNFAYYKEDAGKILLGAFEPNAKPWGMKNGKNAIPESFEFDTLAEDWDHFMPVMERALNRLPLLETAGIHTFFNGPESFTPDDRYLLGPSPEHKNYFVAAGFNSVGIQSAGGAGKVLAEWITNGHPPMDLWDVDIRRMMPAQNNSQYLHKRTTEGLGLLYAMHWPYRQYETARGLRRSPFYSAMKEAGACYGEIAGWERPNWFAKENQKAEYHYSWHRQNWFENASEEHLNVRNNVGLFDLTSFSKFLVTGRDAMNALNPLCSQKLSQKNGRITYTTWLNDQGGIEADLTIMRLRDDRFMVMTGAPYATRHFSWAKNHMPEDAHVFLEDITNQYAVLAVMGPKSRDLLQTITTHDMTDFAFGAVKEIEIGMATVLAARLSYVGELGWELYIPTDQALYVYEEIIATGKTFGLKHAGMHVLDSLRLEKGFRHWGHDITDEDTPLEAGMEFVVNWDKDFIGKDALLKQRNKGLKKCLVQVKLSDPTPMLYHNEPIWRDGVLVGYLTSGSYGYHIGSAIGMGYITHDDIISDEWIKSGNYEIEIAGKKHTATVQLEGLYDPKSLNMRL